MKILFIRRDNIGDLVCTTPSVRAVRECHSDAKIGILVNTYNADIVANNPDIDEIYAYEKAKHAPDKSKLSVWWSNTKVLRAIRKEKYDIAIGCGSYSPRLARYTFLTGAAMRIGYLRKDTRDFSYTVPVCESEDGLHEVERVFRLLSPLGIHSAPPAMTVFPARDEIVKMRGLLNIPDTDGRTPLIAFHISSRRPENRWSAEKFIELGRMISRGARAGILLLWSPGSDKNPCHPGDDEKAEAIVHSMEPKPVACRTTSLRELISALSIADLVVCGDGGAMHIAAALGKPIVTMWGSTNPDRWRPWRTPHAILQTESRRAEDISAGTVFNAVEKLFT